MSSWEGVNELVAVVETGSFTRAARRLGVSTAQVSRQVSALESRLATKLLYRTTRRVSVTEAGQVYYQQCRQILDALEEAERSMTDRQGVPRGRLRLTAPVTYGETTIAPLVNDFVSQFPELEVEMRLTNQKLDLVADGYDLAIRLGKLEDSSMIARRLASRSLYVCASPAYLSAHGTPHALSELDHHNCLLGNLDYWRFQDNGKPRNIRVKGSLRCDSGRVLMDAALKGIGIVQLPDYYVQPALDSGDLIPLLAHYREDDDGIWAVYPHNRHLSPKVRLLLDFFSASLGRS
ncbi:LysR family transcriptional regulator [Marinobacter daepoensis]|uniref:LysR family transcriptional regulator n=1 Tax=Marinobacter daepoensis TaxID=262077 RepID=A0ABS3BDV1_9GAMM|nr:LysR substrate-binding domain-containing protein [Marinobacter daepoensis]MBN7770013.1 LysR family transcriptional regulator [Marinobacter daepoensis]MBY6080401.1 LysR family transcriptional regulator [Marinobacter daepoensis]